MGYSNQVVGFIWPGRSGGRVTKSGDVQVKCWCLGLLLVGGLLAGCSGRSDSVRFRAATAPGLVDESPTEAAEDQAWLKQTDQTVEEKYTPKKLPKGLVAEPVERRYGDEITYLSTAQQEQPLRSRSKDLLERARARAELARQGQKPAVSPEESPEAPTQAESAPPAAAADSALPPVAESQEEIAESRLITPEAVRRVDLPPAQAEPAVTASPPAEPAVIAAPPAEPVVTAALPAEPAVTAAPPAEPTVSAVAVERPPPAAAEAEALPGYRIQLAALPDETTATEEWERLQGAHPGILGSLNLVLQEVVLDGNRGIYLRVQASDFASDEQARAACELLKAKGQNCFVVLP